MRRSWWIGYGLLLLVGALLLSLREREGSLALLAAKPLAAGHLLSTGDLLLGGPYYLRKPIAAGEPISDSDLAPLPGARVPVGMLALAVPLAGGAGPGNLAVGGQAWLCPAPPNALPVRVTSLICAGKGPSCIAIVALPPGRAAAVAKSRPPALAHKPCK